MKNLICKLLGHRSIVVALSHDGGCVLCERCGTAKKVIWTSAFSELTFKDVKKK